MKKRALALLLAFGMVFGNVGSMTAQATEVQDETVIEEDSGEPQENTGIGEGTTDESVQGETEETEPEVAEAENAVEEASDSASGGFHGEISVDEQNVNVVDKDGNVTFVDMSADDTVVPELLEGKAETPQIVNLRQTSGVLEYKEVGTGADGYVAGTYGADAAYLGTSGGKVKFMIGGVIGEIAESKVQLVSKSSAKSVSYYSASGGRLYHYISTNINVTSYGSTLDNGPAPSYLKSGTKYYSYDGHYFYTEDNFGNMLDDYNNNTRAHAVNASTPYYNYFQYLPLRSQSNYTSSTLNTIINNKVASNSKMKNTGATFVEKQNTYGVNALLMTGLAANESAWGSSNIAQTKNNLFGLNAVDSSPGQSANYFASVEQCIKEFAEKWMSKEYLNPKNWKYFGGFLGNKASGMNVKYASDPYWGEKAASMAWNLDKDNGNKDVNKYTIGIKDTIGPNNTVNVRSESNTSSSALYKTPKQGNCAYLILNKTPVNKFYKIQSDGVLNSGRTAIDTSTGNYDFSKMYAYISADYVKLVNSGNGSQTPPDNGGDKPADKVPNPKVPAVSVPSSVKNVLTYSSHVANIGWENSVKNGEQSGTTGLNYPIEGIKLNIKGISDLGIRYSAHVSDIGWQDWVQNGELAGTTGKAKAIEAIKIELTGNAAKSYDIHYRVHVKNKGWMKYVSNGELAGTTGEAKHIEAIQIVFLKKEKDISVPSNVENALEYSTNVAALGWIGTSENGKQSGTIGMNSALTGIKVQIKGISGLGIKYSTHVPNIGWQNYVSDGKESIATSNPKRLEAVKIELTGAQSSKYDIYYRVHAQDYGWLGWAKNGDKAGTQGYGKQLEAIQITLLPKGSKAPGSSENAFVEKMTNISYSSHIRNIGWQDSVSNGAISGTTGKALPIEAMKISLNNKVYSGSIQYSAHVRNIGWQNWMNEGEVAGTTGKALSIEAIKIKLTGNLAKQYDVTYRVHVKDIGWQNWVKNGEIAGTTGKAKHIESIQIKLVKK